MDKIKYFIDTPTIKWETPKLINGWGYSGSLEDKPIHTVEKANKKYIQYELIGLNKSHIKVEKKFDNKNKTMFVIVKGKYKDEMTDWENEININLPVDYKIYDNVSWKINDGILTIILHEIINEQPIFYIYEEL